MMSRRLSPNREKVRARANNRWLGFKCSRNVHDVRAQHIVCPPDIEIRDDPPWTFDSKHIDVEETG